ncbi:12452_t:CDS:2, partial [Gigaspora margarita]
MTQVNKLIDINDDDSSKMPYQDIPVPVNDIKQESNADKLYHRMPKFLDDLCSITHDLCNIEVPLRQNWEKK